MVARDRIMTVLAGASGPICDDCLVPLADLNQRQDAYQVCTHLAGRGVVGRGKGTCTRCGKDKNVSWGLTTAPVASVQAAAATTTDLPVQDDHPWYWEGNVQARIVAYLAAQGYSIRSVADTAARTQGKDIVAVSPGGEELWVSVKGYPENSPGVQARHWFAGAIFDLVLYRSESPTAFLALGLPDGFSTYLNLAPRTSWLRRTTPFAIYWVDKAGAVRVEH